VPARDKNQIAAEKTVQNARFWTKMPARSMNSKPRLSLLAIIGPGILVVATGVGAGDLLTASMAGSQTGLSILWAAAAGGLLKWTLNEGIARWQIATETTLLEGWVTRLGRWMQWLFRIYFLFWTLMVGGALVNACGVAGAALVPLGNPDTSRIAWAILHSLAGLALVWVGGFRLFEKLMTVCIGLMFVGVIFTAALLAPGWTPVARGIFLPTIPAGGLPWALGVLGGVGGTVTLLSYGYWVREKNRSGTEGLRICRIDLLVAYALTAIFGMAMVIIGSGIELEGQGLQIAIELAARLGLALGPAGQWIFLLGFWAAVFSSLLGVWQSAPYIFADFIMLGRRLPPAEYKAIDLAKTTAYRAYLVAIAVAPLSLLWLSVVRIQLAYAIMGALFMPLLALTLLVMNNRRDWVGSGFTSGWIVNAILVVTVLLFAAMGVLQLLQRMPSFGG
jgi:Mn2+/Fe2+ NRAMP family transporter